MKNGDAERERVCFLLRVYHALSFKNGLSGMGPDKLSNILPGGIFSGR